MEERESSRKHEDTLISPFHLLPRMYPVSADLAEFVRMSGSMHRSRLLTSLQSYASLYHYPATIDPTVAAFLPGVTPRCA